MALPLSTILVTLTRISDEYRMQLDDIEDGAERDLIRILLDAEGKTVRVIEKQLRRGELTLEQSVRMVSEIQRVLRRDMVGRGLSWVDDNFSLAYRNGTAMVRDSYLAGEELGVGAKGLRLIDSDPVRAAFINFTEADEVAFVSGSEKGYTLIRQIESDTVTHLREVFTRHVALGSDTNTIAEAILEGGKLKPIGRFSAETRAKMIARTELARIAELAEEVKAREVGIEHFRWHATFDHRTARDSVIRHGKVKTRQEWERYSPDRHRGTPPLRPRDRCMLIPMRRKWIRDDAGRDDFDRAVSEGLRLLVHPDERRFISEMAAASKGGAKISLDFLN